MTWLKNMRRLLPLVKDMQSANWERGRLHREMHLVLNSVTDLSKYHKSISPRMFKKMQWYMVETVWMSQKFADLHQVPLREKEKLSIAFSGVLGGISDIVIDDLAGDNFASKKEFLLNPSEGAIRLPLEKFYLDFFKVFEANLSADNKALVMEYYWKTLEAQFASREQFDANLPQEKLIKILKDKCGFTTLLCRAVVGKELLKQEEEAIYELGGLVQFINDINDLHKDSNQNIRNFANSFATLNEIKQALIQQVSLTFEHLRALPVASKQMNDFLFVFHSFIIITLAQLNHYKFICGGDYQLDRFLTLPQHKTKVRPYLRRNFQYSIPKILNYHFHYPYESKFLDTGV
ncbi:hypothetical protein BKI52_01680 [marine bacterium AO1-C]|nr:hypothetical protein BKI52_01680 [marine bacterium AO1-C]